ncbi:MAG: restriction endonuclease subunit S [Oceanospirillales bacterium]|nr:restriction endonuclease subunit S [Oceanospirillales bacterium]
MLPEGWKNKSLGELTNEKLSYGANSSSIEIDRSNLRYIRITDIDDQGNLSNDAVGIDPIEGSAYILKNNDFLFARSGNTVGKTFLYCEKSHPPSAYAGYLIRYRPNSDKLLPIYLKHFCLSDTYHSWVKSQIRAGAQPNINAKEYASLSLPIPPIPEQKKIAQILSTWDNAISATERLLENSQQRKKALMQQLLTGKKRLPGFEGEWKSKPLSDIAEVYQPKTISQSMLTETGYPVYGANGIIGFYEEFNHANEQIAVTCRGSTCGVVNWTQAQSWITGNAMVINTDNFPDISKKFLFYVLDGSNLSYLISGSGQPQITGSIKAHTVKIPALEEQQKIAAVLSTADQEISALQQKLEALKQEKKALMQQLLTGKRRVQVDDAA